MTATTFKERFDPEQSNLTWTSGDRPAIYCVTSCFRLAANGKVNSVKIRSICRFENFGHDLMPNHRYDIQNVCRYFRVECRIVSPAPTNR